jgi:hypothetical protein
VTEGVDGPRKRFDHGAQDTSGYVGIDGRAATLKSFRTRDNTFRKH